MTVFVGIANIFRQTLFRIGIVFIEEFAATGALLTNPMRVLDGHAVRVLITRTANTAPQRTLEGHRVLEPPVHTPTPVIHIAPAVLVVTLTVFVESTREVFAAVVDVVEVVVGFALTPVVHTNPVVVGSDPTVFALNAVPING